MCVDVLHLTGVKWSQVQILSARPCQPDRVSPTVMQLEAGSYLLPGSCDYWHLTAPSSLISACGCQAGREAFPELGRYRPDR
jgi:hypothetical protein